MALAICSALFLCGCGPSFLDGYVVTKEFRPAHTYQYPMTVLVGKVPITTWQTGHAPDKWYVTIAREKYGNDMRTFEVTRATYEAAKRGEMLFLQ